MAHSLFFSEQCVIAAMGGDAEGRKHVLGLREGAAENAAAVKDLLEDLVARRANPNRRP